FIFTIDVQHSGWQRIEDRARKLGLNDVVRTEGSVPHSTMGDLYRHAHAVFLPTLLECSTAVYPESFMAKVPLITSDRDFARELCRDAAAFVDPLSPDDSARALARVLTDDTYRNRLIDA